MQTPETKTVVVISAGLNEPSNTGLLASRAAAVLSEIAAAATQKINIQRIELRLLAKDISEALVSQFLSDNLTAAVNQVRDADALIVTTPVYKAGPSGLFTSFFQILDNDLLIGTPVLLGATAGTARHALVVDEQLRGLFAYMRTITAPTSLFAAPEDWGDGLNSRINRAGSELFALLNSDFRAKVRSDTWQHYQHSYGSAGGAEITIDLNSDLMRLAAGGN